MTSSAASYNNTSDSIDFDFFEDEDCKKIVDSKQKQRDSSKIITKAVIETEPDISDFPESTTDTHLEQHFQKPSKERLSEYLRKSDCISSPSSSLERKLLDIDDAALETLMNCLAYNDERFHNRDSLSPYSFDFKESSDNSLTESTVTTVTSDFTCISPLSSSPLSSSSCNSLSDDHEENSAADESKPECEIPTDLSVLTEDLKQDQSCTNDEVLDEFKESNEMNSLKTNTSECDGNDQNLESQDESSDLPEAYESDFESYNETKYNLEKKYEVNETVVDNGEQIVHLSDKESHVSTLENELGDISISQSRSSSVKTSYKKRKNFNLTFGREELIRIERDNLILLKKIMVHSKHKPVSLNQQPYYHKKTSTAINRAKLQKKIEQDNYILYSKISAMSRLKKVF